MDNWMEFLHNNSKFSEDCILQRGVQLKYNQLIQNKVRMFGGSYQEIIDCQSEYGYKSKRSLRNQDFKGSQGPEFGGVGHNSFQICTPYEMFRKTSYPIEPVSYNMFCPVCGNFVKQGSNYLVFQSKTHHKNFLAHESCLSRQPLMPMNGIFDEIDEAMIKTEQIVRGQKIMINLPLGGRQFYVQVMVTHPLSQFKFFKLSNKLPLIGSNILWELRNKEQECFSFRPNIICLPLNDFKLTVFISQIGASKNKTKFQAYINLGKKKHAKNTIHIAKSEQMSLYMEIIEESVEKRQTVDSMNFKYGFDLNLPLPLIKFNKIELRMPDQFDTESQYDATTSNINIEDLLSEKNLLMSPDTRLSTIANKFSERPPSPINQNSDRSMQSQDGIDLERLIETNRLKEYVSNNVRSRMFQNFLKEATPQQIDTIIQHLHRQIAELATHQYANYMIQKLFTVCNLNQRISIMKGLRQDIPNLVQSKQGTHTIQSFISLFISNEEYELMCNAIQPQFIRLSCHSNSTHFIQKIINIFPLEHTVRFFHIACKNLQIFATNKNAMCVLKHQMRKIKENDNIIEVEEIKKQFIRVITINTDKIIQDSYGNYIVQFCYELFGNGKSSAITQMILARFAQFSIQKYSSSVVFRCVSQFWDTQTIERLKYTLANEGIIQMYRNKDGNKILLEIMEKYQHTLLREKIYTLLLTGEPARFSHQRWGSALGPRTGQVGSQFSSFSEAAFGNKTKSSASGSKSNRKKYNR